MKINKVVQQLFISLDDILFPQSCIACRNRFVSMDSSSIIRSLFEELNVYYYLLAENYIDFSETKHEVLFITKTYEDLLKELCVDEGICYKCYRQIKFRSISNVRIFVPLQLNVNELDSTVASLSFTNAFIIQNKFLAVITSCDYAYPISALVRLLKFNNATYVLKFIAKLYYLAFLRYSLAMYFQQITVSPFDIRDFDCCVALPLHKKRLYERSYNQAELILEDLNKYLKLENLSKYIYRIKYTERQSETDGAKGRRANLLNVFECDETVFVNKKVLLLDDVMTSGASLTEASKALYAAGAKVVVAIVLASNKGSYHYFVQN